jgi:RNA polymerase sigma-54 factor
MKQSLQLRLSQHLALTPQLQQSIRLLQLSSIELSQELEQMLQENPLLERGAEEDFVPSTPDGTPSASGEAEAAPEPAAEPSDTAETDFSSLESERWEKTASTASDDDDTEYTFQEPDTPTLR